LTRFSSADDLVASINAETDSTGVFASILRNGNVALQNNDLGGDNIVLSGSSAGLGTNALGISSKAYIGSISMRLESGDGDPIRFDLGQSGEPSDLNILGLDTQVRLSGQIDEDLLVFVGGSGTAMISAHSEGSDLSVADGLRSRRLEFEFTASDQYVIRDLTTNTILAERTYQGEVSLDYQGIEIVLDQQARVGDSFIVDGNNLGPGGSFDAQGNNSNVLRMIDIESSPLLAGDLTLTEGYLSFVGDVGNVATQSEIARDALEIVRKQAIEARDRVAGVNLDKEAADLIRFQQAYQASAQVMQAASKIFDTILQIR
jgi:flagellar hook-associated protein FlgK